MKIKEFLEHFPEDENGNKNTYRKVKKRIDDGNIPAKMIKGQWEIETYKIDNRFKRENFHNNKHLKNNGGGSLKDALTEMQIKKIQQQLEDGKQKIRDEFKSELMENIFSAFEELRKVLNDLNLKKSEIEKLRRIIDKQLNSLRSSSTG